MHEGAVLVGRFSLQHTGNHLYSGIAQPLHTTTGNTGVGIGQRHHHPSDPCLDHGVGAGRGAAVMAAGFQGDDDRATAGGITGLGQSPYFGMGLTGPGMESLPNEGSVGIQHHCANKRIRTGAAFSQTCQS